MIKYIPIGMTFFILGCASPRYLFVDSDILQRNIEANGRIPIKRYVLTPENFPDEGLAFINAEPTKSYLAVLKKNSPKKAARFIQSDAFTRTADPTVKSFCFALYYFVASQYDSCMMQINKLDENVKTCFIRLIMTDCDFETTRSFGNPAFDEFVEKYQKVLDCNHNELNKEIIKNRIKLMRYGY
jgi:hypothetical protein